VSPVLVDSNVLLDIATEDPRWFGWSSSMVDQLAQTDVLVIDPIIYAEVSVHYDRIEELDIVIPPSKFRRDPLPYEAGFLAGRALIRYRRAGGARAVPVPDLYIGAHAAVAGYRLLTRDATRYRTYFPTVGLIAP